jgi:hypothetical protein
MQSGCKIPLSMQHHFREWRIPALCGALALASVLTGCASAPRVESLEPHTLVDACRRWYADLDQVVNQFDAGDAQDRRVQGFPQLRQSRLSASFREQAGQSDAAFAAWVAQMRELGDDGSAVEIANVPIDGWRRVFPGEGLLARDHAMAKTRVCAELLSKADLSQADRRATLLAQPGVPDSYSTLARVLGLYAVTRWPFSAGVSRWQEDTQNAFAGQGDLFAGPVQRFVPDPARVDDPAERLAQASRDALGVPQLNGALKHRLLDRHAPILALAPQGDFDRFGAMTLTTDGSAKVDPQKPVVYRRVAFTRLGASTLVQLVYLYWFSERPPSGPLDLLGGALDGVMWRVTLDEQGRPLVYDSAHACGCYHLFFPAPGLRARPSPQAGTEWVFTPALAPHLAPDQRVVLGLDARTHYLSAVASTAVLSGTPYASLDASRLRSLRLDGRDDSDAERDSADRRSLYRSDGIVSGTERGERYLFWPMGVRDAGAQRQWGHHATAFVGRRHFDDPDLIERRFERVSHGLSQDRSPANH